MSEREEMLALADRLENHVNDRGGCFKDDDGNIVIPNGAWSMMLCASKALRSTATPAPGYAQGFEACREELRKYGSPPYSLVAIEDAFRAIAALPAPAGEEVTVEDIAPIICEELFGIYVASELAEHSVSGQSRKAASAILSHFTILAKPDAQEPRS